MKTVKQQAEILFKALDFSDKVVMLPLMNMFAAAIRANMKVDIMITEDMPNEYITPEQTKKIFKVLSDLGCRTSLGESYEDIVKSNNSQNEKQKCCILQLFNVNQNNLKAITIIKNQLNLSLKEAKDLVDSCPIAIDLRNYKIEQPNYEILFNSLKQIGCICSLQTEKTII